jgi:hypothetical protein
MKRFFWHIAHFFWSWHFLKIVLWTATIIVLFYAEEDWRGARAWAATKAKWEARGESFDPAKFDSPSIPDEQNLGAIPLFKLEPDPKRDGGLLSHNLTKALRQSVPNDNLPRGDLPSASEGNGRLPDMKRIRNGIAVAYAEAFKTAPPSPDPLQQLDALYPFIADMRTASASRKYCSFPQGNTRSGTFVYRSSVLLLNPLAATSMVLVLHAVVALNEHQSDLSLDDIKITFKLASGLRRQSLPPFCSYAIYLNSENQMVISDGLSLHAWDDAQLVEIQDELSSLDFLSDYQRMTRGECIIMTIPSYDEQKKDRTGLKNEFHEIHEYDPKKTIPDLLPDFWPNGWFDWMKAQQVTFCLNTLRFADLKTRTVFPEIFVESTAEIARRQKRWDSRAPWSMFFSGGAATDRLGYMLVYARAQVHLDETRIACALERYRMAQGVYPASLEELAPAFIDELPHDVMNDESYHYRLQADGTYLLYSVGWNQEDDGGKVVLENNFSPRTDDKRGDWPWVMPR